MKKLDTSNNLNWSKSKLQKTKKCLLLDSKMNKNEETHTENRRKQRGYHFLSTKTKTKFDVAGDEKLGNENNVQSVFDWRISYF